MTEASSPESVVQTGSRRSIWPSVTVATMAVGYAGYYLCRSNLSVARPLILDAFSDIDKAKIGAITSVATLLYALGKFIFGAAADAVGGRRMFLFGMIGAVFCTFLFGLGGPPLFLIAWCGNRFVQSAGWVGIVKVGSRWFAPSSYGRMMGFVSLSFLFGDFASRIFLGWIIARGADWRDVFLISGAGLALMVPFVWLLLRESATERGLPEAAPPPQSLTQDGGGLGSLLRSRTFWTVCALSFGFTLMRETFNDWTPTYLHESAGLSKAGAASASSLFPLFGGLSVLGVGWLSDRLPKGGRAGIIVTGLALGTIGLGLLASGSMLSPEMKVAAIAAIGFVLIGPYSLLAGAISLDLGGRSSSASAAGWIDGVGYIGGILSGYGVAKVAETAGWGAAFGILAGVAAVSGIVATTYWAQERRSVDPQRS